MIGILSEDPEFSSKSYLKTGIALEINYCATPPPKKLRCVNFPSFVFSIKAIAKGHYYL